MQSSSSDAAPSLQAGAWHDPCALLLGAASGEPASTAVLLLIFGVLVTFSVVFSRTVDRLGLPVVLLFILLGMMGGSEGIGGLEFDNYELSVRLGTIALVLILFDGGLNTSVASIRSVMKPAATLATLGVLLTAAFVAVLARLLGLSWPEALLLGAVVSSTDAAAVFAVLRGGRLQLRPRVGRTIEVESCVNDPMAVILTMTLIQILLTPGGSSWWMIALAVPIQLIVGTVVGLLIGWLGRLLMMRVRIQTVGLYPALSVSIAFISFAMATLLQGSGFLAVFVAGVVLGAARLPYRQGLARIHDAIAWISQVGMFLMLGLLVFPSELIPMAWKGIAIALLLALVARPLAVALCLLPFRYPWREVLYIGGTGLRGAVPIILAAFPILAGVPGAMSVFNLVFFVVLFSIFFPGILLRPMTRWLKLSVPDKPLPAAVLEINASTQLQGELSSFLIDPSVAVCGAQLRDISFPDRASIVLIVRGNALIAARGSTVICPGDHIYICHEPEHRGLIELMFGSPEEG